MTKGQIEILKTVGWYVRSQLGRQLVTEMKKCKDCKEDEPCPEHMDLYWMVQTLTRNLENIKG